MYHYEEGNPELAESPVHGVSDQFSFISDVLNHPTGAFELRLGETNRGLPVRSAFSGTNRLFIFDVASKVVIFKTTTLDGRTIVLFEPIKENSLHEHHVVATWATNGAMLLLDTNIASDSFP
jgi:hypothetical protein